MSRNGFLDPRLFFNRHLSWMQFNQRVLEEARDPRNPLLERVKFLAITASNLDEFVEVRLAGLHAASRAREVARPGPTADTGAGAPQLADNIHAFVDDQYECWREDLVPRSRMNPIRVLRLPAICARSARADREFLLQDASSRCSRRSPSIPRIPFPHVLNKALCLAFLLQPQRKRIRRFISELSPCRAPCRAWCACRRRRTKSSTFFFTTSFDAFAERLYHGYEDPLGGAVSRHAQ